MQDVAESWHSITAERVLEVLSTDGDKGLSSEEARKRSAIFGPNLVRREKTKGAIEIFLLQFRNVLIVILLVAISISAALGELVDAAVIAVIVALAAAIGFIQEYRAEKVFETLKGRLGATSAVVRDGLSLSLPATDLVPGDIVLLESGTIVPADVRLTRMTAMQIDESLLTGESVTVAKTTAPLPSSSPVEERSNIGFAGTAVTYGRARGVVVATGERTEFGKIVRETMEVRDEETPLERQIASIGKNFGALALVVITIVGLVEGARAASTGTLTLSALVDVFLFAVALAVAAVPEALPAIVTGTLAIGMRILAKNNALVRRMPAVEALGSTEVICFDKTGTLTSGEMTVREVYVDRKALKVNGVGYAPSGSILEEGRELRNIPEPLAELGTAALLCNDSALREDGHGRWEVVGDPTEGALISLAGKLRQNVVPLQRERVAEIPFSSERKLMTTVHRQVGGYMAYVKGAPESVLSRCVSRRAEAGLSTLREADRQELTSVSEEMSSRGLRVLALGSRRFEDMLDWSPAVEAELVFLGLVGMEDPLREDAVEAVERARKAGLKPVMITGDHRSTAMTVAGKAGILKPGDGVLTGVQLQQMPQTELEERVLETTVYARISPLDKLKIVDAWKKKGRVVAMTGDGVNDAPALKSADIGIAMGISGTDVAKEAADIVLVDDNFASLVRAVELGRWIYDDIRKSLAYLLQSNLVEMTVLALISLVIAPFVGLPEGVLPLLPVQILYVNLATDGFPALALGFSPMDSDLLSRPPRSRNETIFTRDLQRLLASTILVQVPVLLLAFMTGLPSGVDEARTRLFLMLIFMELALAVSCRSLSQSILKVRPHRWLVASVVWEAILIAALLQIPQTRDALHVLTPGPQDVLWIAGGVFLTMVASEVAKWLDSQST